MPDYLLCAKCGKPGAYIEQTHIGPWKFASPFRKGVDGKYRHDICKQDLKANG